MITSHWLDKADQLAENAKEKGEWPVGAVVVKITTGDVTRRDIIGEGQNRRVEFDFNPTAHAEINALVDASKNLSRGTLQDCILYTSLEPCVMCAAACKLARLKGVVFRRNDYLLSEEANKILKHITPQGTWFEKERTVGLSEHASKVFRDLALPICDLMGAVVSGGAVSTTRHLHRVTNDVDFHIPEPFDETVARKLGLTVLGSKQHDAHTTITRCFYDDLPVDFLFELNTAYRKQMFEDAELLTIEEQTLPAICPEDSFVHSALSSNRKRRVDTQLLAGADKEKIKERLRLIGVKDVSLPN